MNTGELTEENKTENYLQEMYYRVSFSSMQVMAFIENNVEIDMFISAEETLIVFRKRTGEVFHDMILVSISSCSQPYAGAR